MAILLSGESCELHAPAPIAAAMSIKKQRTFAGYTFGVVGSGHHGRNRKTARRPPVYAFRIGFRIPIFLPNEAVPKPFLFLLAKDSGLSLSKSSLLRLFCCSAELK
jgi:hypothetical protein